MAQPSTSKGELITFRIDDDLSKLWRTYQVTHPETNLSGYLRSKLVQLLNRPLMLCPFCAMENTHLVSTEEQYEGVTLTESSIEFICENGCRWQERWTFYKGRIHFNRTFMGKDPPQVPFKG